MGQRIIGLDIGSYALKAVYLDSTFRRFQLVGVKEMRLPASGEDGVSPEMEAVAAWLAEEAGAPETIVTALTGDSVLVRFLSLPFRDRKRIGEVIGFELQDLVPYDLDEIVYDFQVVGQEEDSSRVLAAAVPREHLEPYLNSLKEVGVDPKAVSFGAWSYQHLAPYLGVLPDERLAVVDIGQEHLDDCVVHGEHVEFVRTMNRAGAFLNQEVADRLGVSERDADLQKRRHGSLDLQEAEPEFAASRELASFRDADDLVSEVPDDAPLESDTPILERSLNEALVDAMEHVARDIRLALLAHESEYGRSCDRVLLCGGTSRLPGVHAFLERRCHVPVEPLDLSGLEFNRLEEPARTAEVVPKGLALGLRALSSGSAGELNLRQGPYAFEGEFRFLREKLLSIALIVLALLSIAGFRAWSQYTSLQSRNEQQIAEVQRLSQQLVGREISEYEVLVAELTAPGARFESPFPDIEAFDLFYDISEIIEAVNTTPRDTSSAEDPDSGSEGGGERPPEDRYVIELENVRLDKTTGTLRGEANDIEAYELFFQRLRQHPCLRKVETQSTDIVTFRRHTGWRRFQVRFAIECPPDMRERLPADRVSRASGGGGR